MPVIASASDTDCGRTPGALCPGAGDLAVGRIRHALLVHGAGGGGWEWNVWRGVFAARGIQAIAPDLQPAVAGLEATAWDDYLRQVQAALDPLPHPRALVGASLGGLLAAACAVQADALVLVNPLPPAPWAMRLPARTWPARVPWQRNARLDSTRCAMPDSDDAGALYAMRRWRDESGAVLAHADAGVAIDRPQCAVLCIASSADDDVPPSLTATLAHAWGSSLLHCDASSHVGPLLGRSAAATAAQAAGWLSAR